MKTLDRVHNSLKPTVYLASLMVGVLFSVYLSAKIFEILKRGVLDYIAIAVIGLLIVYWSVYFAEKIWVMLWRRER